MFLSEPDIELLKKLSVAVDSNLSADELAGLCRETALRTDDRLFPFTYAGILLAVKDRISDAIKIMEFSTSHPIPFVIREYLVETQSFEPGVTVFQDTRPLDAWVKTNFYKSYITATTQAISEFAAGNPCPETDGSPVIMDIGFGNGVMIAEIINKLAETNGLKGVRLISLDLSPEMLKSCEAYCREHVSVPIDFTPVCCKIQEITDEQISLIKEYRPIWFVMAAASMHHMPRELKISTLKRLKSISEYFLIFDFHANNDLPKRGTPEFVYSVVESYRYYIDDILNSPITQEEKKLCLNDFCVVEMIKMLKYDWPARTDYHATIQQWEELAEKAGYHVAGTTPTISLNKQPMTFVMELKT